MKINNNFYAPLICIILVAACLPAHALTITATYDSSFTANSGTNASAEVADINYVIQQFDQEFTNPISINITIDAETGTTYFGASSIDEAIITPTGGTSAYTQVRGYLLAAGAPAADLPVADPTGGGNFVIATAEAKALGISVGAGSDGTFYFGAGYNFNFDQSNRAVAGEYDFIGVVEHEFTEIMGRIPELGATVSGTTGYTPYDLFRYKGSNTRDLTAGNGDYFSIDNGATDLKNYNFPNGNGSDPQDWASGSNDAFNAFSVEGTENDVTPVDFTVMNALGYTSIPEPRTLGYLLIGLAGIWAIRKRRMDAGGMIPPSRSTAIG